MPLSISARFLANLYQGRDSGGVPERYPSPDRLYKALVSTAYTTFRFRRRVEDENDDGPDDAAIEAALRWLEGNPPDSVRLPAVLAAAEGESADVVVYRDKGYIDRTKGKQRPKIESAGASVAAFYADGDDGLLTWQWRNDPEPTVLTALSALCAEVPYLGEACSKVRLVVSTELDFPLPGALLRAESDGFNALRARGPVFAYPGEGRLEELDDGYARCNVAKGGKVGEKEDEQNLLQAVPMTATEEIATYLRTEGGSRITEPWPRGLLIPVTPDEAEGVSGAWNPPESDYVGWSVALHRFLVKAWGIDPPAVLLGKYQKGTGDQPANNIAIQPFTARMAKKYAGLLPEAIARRLPAFLLLLPEHMTDDEAIGLYETCRRSAGSPLYFARNRQRIRLGEPVRIDATRFWNPPAEDTVRFWFPSPMAIAETRAIPASDGRRRWSSRESVYLSLGHVWRDHFALQRDNRPEDRYEDRIWSFVDRVRDDVSLRCLVFDARTVYRLDMVDYVHHAHESNTIRGLSALISINADGDGLDCAALAIGQSRHLGGGFLLPVDLPKTCLNLDGRDGQEVPVWLT